MFHSLNLHFDLSFLRFTGILFLDLLFLSEMVFVNGIMFVSDTGNHMIRKISSSDQVTTFAGNIVSGYWDEQETNAGFNSLPG
jgi:hypothetical protein